MNATHSVGIDYGTGTTNRNPDTGIRYGVISMNRLSQWAWEDVEADYGEPTCGHCGNEAVEWDMDTHDSYEGDGSDYACEHCERSFDSSDAFGEEPVGHTHDGAEKFTVDSYGDAFVVASPYYTRAAFCSPCAPGACHLENPTPDGAKAYCLGTDWFDDDNPCPYPVFRADTNECVYAPAGEPDTDIPAGWSHV